MIQPLYIWLRKGKARYQQGRLANKKKYLGQNIADEETFSSAIFCNATIFPLQVKTTFKMAASFVPRLPGRFLAAFQPS